MGSVFVVAKGQNRPTALFIHQYVLWCSQWKILMDIHSAIVAIYSTPEGVTRDPTDWETRTSFEKFNFLVLGQNVEK